MMMFLLQMAGGIPNLPDLTQPNTLISLGRTSFWIFIILVVGFIATGMILALLNWSLRSTASQPHPLSQDWLDRYHNFGRALPHLGLILLLLGSGFLLSATLSRRYHYWEQAKVEQASRKVAGNRLEQASPQIRYSITETTLIPSPNGKTLRREKQKVDRYLNLAGSVIEVDIDQTTDPQKRGLMVYRVDFAGGYEVKNTLKETKEFFFDVSPPSGYTILQDFRVEREGTRLEPTTPQSYSFPFELEAGEETSFRVTYQTRGAPRWVYTAYKQLLSNFRLYVSANFPRADFASGILPTETQNQGEKTRYSWIFTENVSVENPFGVFTTSTVAKNLGVLPRFLFLAPAIFLWWLLLLYLSLPMSLRKTAIAGGIFFACILALTYLSRLLAPSISWGIISVIFLVLAGGLGSKGSSVLKALICTLCGGILPILGLLIPYSGLTLSIAGLLSIAVLIVQDGYGRNGVKQIE